MAVLIELLNAFPASGERMRAAAMAERLDRLANDAQHAGAAEVTLASIKGARVLLDLAEISPKEFLARPTATL
jgi:hypothetical protein